MATPEKLPLKVGADFHGHAARAADPRFRGGPCAKRFAQSANSSDPEGKPVSQPILAPWADPLQFCKANFDQRGKLNSGN
jgi:hypothetical protein